MRIDTFRIFCSLADMRSFSKTAEKHGLSQSAISQKLAQLETDCKCKLIDRDRKPISLTDEGKLFLKTACDILDRYESFNTELKSIHSSAESRINVCTIFSVGMHLLPSYMKEFMMKYPKINMHVEYLSSARVYELVLCGEFDIGLVAVPKKDKRLKVYEFQDEPLVFVCSQKHPLAGKKQVHVHDIMYEKFIAFEKDVPTRLLIDNYFHKYNAAIDPTMEFDNTEMIKYAVEANVGVSILPSNTLLQEVAASQLCMIPFSGEEFVRPIGVVVPKDRVLSEPASDFMALLVDRQQGLNC